MVGSSLYSVLLLLFSSQLSSRFCSGFTAPLAPLLVHHPRPRNSPPHDSERISTIRRSGSSAVYLSSSDQKDQEEVDVAIVGAGFGALCAGAILNTLYGLKVGVYESHYLAGGCAHAFTRKSKDGNSYTFGCPTSRYYEAWTSFWLHD